MKTLLLGGSGQLGLALQETAPSGIELEVPPVAELSFENPERIEEFVEDLKPTLVINAAAFTAVAEAEKEPETARVINSEGPAAIARSSGKVGARLIHVSTDFVFDGTQGAPYRPEDAPRPIGEYGKSKLAGEQAVRQALEASSLIIRTSWLYSHRRENFVLTILRLLETEPEVRVIADQIGSPTSTASLAPAIWKWAELKSATGIRHFCDAGVASWYDFAQAIKEEAVALGLVEDPAPVRPIRASEFPSQTPRPASSALDASESWKELDMEPLHWREPLRRVLMRVLEQSNG